jgi:hypothetical protein
MVQTRPKGRRRYESDATRSLSVLKTLRTFFDVRSARVKMQALQKLQRAKLLSTRELLDYHEYLCFARAYPDNQIIFTHAEHELQHFGERVLLYISNSDDDDLELLEDTGLTQTNVVHAPSYDLARILTSWFPTRLSIAWDYVGKSTKNNLGGLLPLVVTWQENDTFDNDPHLDVRKWLSKAHRSGNRTDLEDLLDMLEHSGLPDSIRSHLYDSLQLQTRWDLGDSNASRSRTRVPCRTLFYQQEPILGRASDLRSVIREPGLKLKHLSPAEGRTYARLINEVLAVRYRELHPVTYANPHEVYVAEPGRGVQIAIFGTRPEARLPLESDFGAMLVRNGIPVGYGVGATLFERVEIAMNMFPTFRSGESSFIIEQFFRIFYHHFGSRLFLVRSRQMGDGDDEPILSGAFWFYNKLGFRAMRKSVRNLAEQERIRLDKNPGRRSSTGILKRLSKSDVYFNADGSAELPDAELSVADLGRAVTGYIAKRYDGNRELAVHDSAKHLRTVLGVGNLVSWPKDEVTALERLAPLICAIPDLTDWSPEEKVRLIRLIRAKGATCERTFVLSCIAHGRFKNALLSLAAMK